MKREMCCSLYESLESIAEAWAIWRARQRLRLNYIA